MNCNHEALVDTGIGYYHCPTCDEGWTYNEWKLMNNNPAPDKPKTAELKVIWCDDMRTIQVINHKGDTYTSASEEFMDFILCSEQDINREQYARQKVEEALKMVCKKKILKMHCGTNKTDTNIRYYQNGADNIQIDKGEIMSVLNELCPEETKPDQ